MSSYAFHIPFYATLGRADVLQQELESLTPKLLREGATEVRVYRSKEDPFRLRQIIQVPDKDTWERLWNSEVFVSFRTNAMGWYQKPLAYEAFEAVSVQTASGVADPFTEAA